MEVGLIPKKNEKDTRLLLLCRSIFEMAMGNSDALRSEHTAEVTTPEIIINIVELQMSNRKMMARKIVRVVGISAEPG